MKDWRQELLKRSHKRKATLCKQKTHCAPEQGVLF
jgi:hypothetical protein